MIVLDSEDQKLSKKYCQISPQKIHFMRNKRSGNLNRKNQGCEWQIMKKEENSRVTFRAVRFA